MVGLSQLREAGQLPIAGPITPEQKLAFIKEALDRFDGGALRASPGDERAEQRVKAVVGDVQKLGVGVSEYQPWRAGAASTS